MRRHFFRRAAALLLLSVLLTSGSLAAMTTDEMNASVEGKARFTIAGMKKSDYEAALSTENYLQILCADTLPLPEYDITKAYTYQDITDMLITLSAHEDVRTEIIGQSKEGRDIYSIAVGSGERVIMVCTGLVAREAAGTSYTMAQIISLLDRLDAGDEQIERLLSLFTIVAVPCASPDGRAMLDASPSLDWRANANGVDLGLNFPTSEAGQLAANAHQAYRETEPGPSGYGGANLGSEPETRALIGWVNAYIDRAVLFIDLEQYGRNIYPHCSYLSDAESARSMDLARDLAAFLQSDNAVYSVVDNEEYMRGWTGGSIADFAAELAEGLVFSGDYGRLGLATDAGVLPLCLYGSLADHEEAYAPRSPMFASVTIEISTKGGTGYYDNARGNHMGEYTSCGFDTLFAHLMLYALTNLTAAE